MAWCFHGLVANEYIFHFGSRQAHGNEGVNSGGIVRLDVLDVCIPLRKLPLHVHAINISYKTSAF